MKQNIVARSLACLFLIVAIAGPAAAEPSRNHPAVRRAFRSVVEKARQSTVHVLAGDKRVALGAVVDADGLIVTKASELKGSIKCRLVDGKNYPATLLGADADHDIALLKVDAKDLVPVRWREGGSPPVGSLLATTSTTADPLAIGVVSVAPRQIRRRMAFLGIGMEPHDAGVQINTVLDGSAAADAGLQLNDIVTHLNDTAVEGRQTFSQRIRRMRPGEKVKLRVKRDDKQLDLVATLGTPDLNGARADRFSQMNALGSKLSTRRAGFPVALQHDTVLQRTQCGGPLVDVDGKVIGINIARAGRVNSYAIPADVVQKIVADLKKRTEANGKAETPS